MYKVIKRFTDLQDHGHHYNVGDTFPREGVTVTDARIKQLASNSNRQGVPLISEVEEETVTEEIPEASEELAIEEVQEAEEEPMISEIPVEQEIPIEKEEEEEIVVSKPKRNRKSKED